MSVTEARAGMSRLLTLVSEQGQRTVIERRGTAVAAVVSMDDLERLELERPASQQPLGALALVGAWRDVGDELIDEMVEEIYASRDRERGQRE